MSLLAARSAVQTVFSRQHLPWLVVLAGLLAMYVPTFWDLRILWASDDQGHGPIIAAITVWLLWQLWPAIAPEGRGTAKPLTGMLTLLIASFFYVLGRSQAVLFFEVGSLVFMLAGVALLLRGADALKLIWFPLFFLCFMVPLPAAVVAAVTGPMKMAVSFVAEQVLHQFGYPISRSGVILQIGQYQLLVADACSGLHTLLTLEALGLLYLNIVRSTSAFRNIALALLVVPISFMANVIRVIVLTLVTYHFGDDAGQGFLHGFAGMVLFMTALLLIIATDSVISKLVHTSPLAQVRRA